MILVKMLWSGHFVERCLILLQSVPLNEEVALALGQPLLVYQKYRVGGIRLHLVNCEILELLEDLRCLQ